MCGIAGYYSDRLLDKEEKRNNFVRSLGHRGPDGHGSYENDTIGLVHTRLSIIDVSEKGNQPLYNEDKTIVLICNGEIYNYLLLRSELVGKGHIFSSNSDSEVIIHLYEEYRNDFKQVLEKLTGMFAFALYDTERKDFFIARDRIGIKPLYYYNQQGDFIFASEVKPIAASGIGKVSLDNTSLYEYFLLGSIPAPNTLFNEIKALDPGHYIRIAAGKISINKYWEIPLKLNKWNKNELAEVTEALLTNVIKDHLVADVPVGTFLSAGVDSSLITSIAAQYHPGIYSFTASFPGEPEDEGVVAARIAYSLKTTHLSYNLEGDFFKDFEMQFKDIDQPFAISSALSLGRISKLAMEKVKVVLSGDGGDELFAGYNRHTMPYMHPLLKKTPSSTHDVLLKTLYRVTGKEKFKKLREYQLTSDAVKYQDKISVSEESLVLSLFPLAVRRQIDTKRYIKKVERVFEECTQDDYLNKLLYVDFKTSLVDEMLTKCDRMTMINGIEGRVPLLDHRVVEFAFSIPSAFKRQDNTGKTILRDILEKYHGREFAYRKKTGFNSPLKQWLANDTDTREYALNNINGLVGKELLDDKSLNDIHSNIFAHTPDMIYGLVCLNNYLDNNKTLINTVSQ